ncbi:HAD-IIIC family phosphatase [Actinophytocola sp.]|jgi:methoxymalonate biosynthesis protein|uniref:HAD-IIIC family phosphatase n=1 Tax=Actinophytocola sp. TaxID=1872138 RepID=UPI002EDA9110
MTDDRPAKCLIWDLDNTLWQGTLLEDERVRLTDTVRRTVATLDSRGIVQSIASKNDHDHAWSLLEELGMAEYFLLPMIGWGPKSHSVRRIADELRFAHSAVAFVDDQPAERAEVTHHLPDVRCYSHEQVPLLTGLPEFSPATVTVDARNRRTMYQANLRRKAEQESFTGPDEDFLRSLELVLRITRAREEELSRVDELTLRTSQMNATGVHYSDTVLRGLLADPRHEVLVATMSDRFGPQGAIGLVLLAKHRGSWHLKLLATSCRVVSFGAGGIILNWLVDQASRAGVHLVADFRATDRNRMMEIAYRFAGFADHACSCMAEQDLPAPDVQRLHLVPGPRSAPTTMRLAAPTLTGAPPERRPRALSTRE